MQLQRCFKLPTVEEMGITYARHCSYAFPVTFAMPINQLCVTSDRSQVSYSLFAIFTKGTGLQMDHI